MYIAAAVVSGLFAAALLMSARAKLVKDKALVVGMAKVGVPEDKLWLLAAAEIAGAAGLLVGLLWWPIGVAAAIGLILYFLGAIASHLRVRDKAIAPATVLLIVAVAALALRATTT
jgi:DoxX-like family